MSTSSTKEVMLARELIYVIDTHGHIILPSTPHVHTPVLVMFRNPKQMDDSLIDDLPSLFPGLMNADYTVIKKDVTKAQGQNGVWTKYIGITISHEGVPVCDAYRWLQLVDNVQDATNLIVQLGDKIDKHPRAKILTVGFDSICEQFIIRADSEYGELTSLHQRSVIPDDFRTHPRELDGGVEIVKCIGYDNLFLAITEMPSQQESRVAVTATYSDILHTPGLVHPAIKNTLLVRKLSMDIEADKAADAE